jgi:molecular chaperone GrpE
VSDPKGDGRDEDLPVPVARPAGEEGAPEDGSLAAADAPAVEGGPAGDDGTEALRRERDDLREALLRRRADFENYRRRVERDRAAAATEAEAAILRQILGTVDNLERALAAAGTDSALREGVALTLRELAALLESLGVATVDPLARPFDPAVHQAILHEPAPGFEPGTVAVVFRKGYTYKGRLLRPAFVKVASAGAWEGPEGGEVQ